MKHLVHTVGSCALLRFQTLAMLSRIFYKKPMCRLVLLGKHHCKENTTSELVFPIFWIDKPSFLGGFNENTDSRYNRSRLSVFSLNPPMEDGLTVRNIGKTNTLVIFSLLFFHYSLFQLLKKQQDLDCGYIL